MIDWSWKNIGDEKPKFVKKVMNDGHRIEESDSLLLAIGNYVAMGKFVRVENVRKAKAPKFFFISGTEDVSNRVYYWQYAPKA